MSQQAYIADIYNFLPEKVYTNQDFFSDFPQEKNQPSYQKLGIQSRHIMDSGTSMVDYMVQAVNQWFKKSGVKKEEIDFLLVHSFQQDYLVTPYNATLLHTAIGLRKSAGALDITSGCSAYAYGLSVAAALTERNAFKNVLFVSANSLTRTIYRKDKSNRFLFGDAVSVTHISTRNTPGIGNFVFGADGDVGDKIRVRDGGIKSPVTGDSHKEITDQFDNVTTPASFYMDGAGVFLYTTKILPGLVTDTLAVNHCTANQVDYFIFHQTNHFMNDALRKRCEIPENKFLQYMENTGNTVASTIPIVIEHFKQNGTLKPGNKVLLAGFGSGFSWCATIITV